MNRARSKAALRPLRDKLKKIFLLLSSDQPNEVVAAATKLKELLGGAGLDMHIFAELALGDDEKLADLFKLLLAKDPDILVKLAWDQGKYFRSLGDDIVFADIVVRGHRRTVQLNDGFFGDWLRQLFLADQQRTISKEAVGTAVQTLRSKVRFGDETFPVFQRVGSDRDGRIFIDLGDETGQSIVVDQSGWSVINEAPVRFRRPGVMGALPVPVRGGKIVDLRSFVRCSDGDFVLLASFLVDAFFPGRPRPVLYVGGEEGNGKTTLARVVRQLIDPNSAPVRALPNTVRDLAVAAHNAACLSFDNVSKIPSAISDALCMLSSGSGFGKRALFKDADEFVVAGARAVILNGRHYAVEKADLNERVLRITCPRLSSGERKSDVVLGQKFETAAPYILGALLDAVSLGLRGLPRVRERNWPRLIDFARLGCAIETAIGGRGSFMRALQGSAEESNERVAENDPAVVAVRAFMRYQTSWTGTMTALLEILTSRDPTEERVSRWRSWPKDPTRLSADLRDKSALLQKLGIELTFDLRTGKTRQLEIRVMQNDSADAGDATDADDAADMRRRASGTGRSSLALMRKGKASDD